MDNAAMEILGLMQPQGNTIGLKVIRVLTTEPDDITVAFEGSSLALDLDIFEVPISMYPLLKDDQFLGLPILGKGYSQRWGLLAKLTSGVIMATMKGPDSLKLDGSEMLYPASRVIVPQYVVIGTEASVYHDSYSNKASDEYFKAENVRALKDGDRVSVLPTKVGDVIKYIVAAIY